VLQCVAVCCSVLQCVAVRCSVLQYVAVCCSVLQRVAACAENCSVLHRDVSSLMMTTFTATSRYPADAVESYSRANRFLMRKLRVACV